MLDTPDAFNKCWRAGKSSPRYFARQGRNSCSFARAVRLQEKGFQDKPGQARRLAMARSGRWRTPVAGVCRIRRWYWWPGKAGAEGRAGVSWPSRAPVICRPEGVPEKESSLHARNYLKFTSQSQGPCAACCERRTVRSAQPLLAPPVAPSSHTASHNAPERRSRPDGASPDCAPC